jgi:hypothetical protein
MLKSSGYVSFKSYFDKAMYFVIKHLLSVNDHLIKFRGHSIVFKMSIMPFRVPN